VRWRDLLEEHDQVVQGTVDEFDGRLIKSTGDSHLVLFERSASAVKRAPPFGVELRAGLHSGEVEIVGDDVADWPGLSNRSPSRMMRQRFAATSNEDTACDDRACLQSQR
jgi:class 3 adenylate cyclase